MHWEVTYGYKNHCGVQVLSVKGATELHARSMFHHTRPKEVGFHIISIKPH